MTTTPTHLTDRFGKAMQFALELHRTQPRKGGEIPYIAHLLAVTALVLEDGGSEDEAIAALLHDAIEDQPREGRTAHEIDNQFGKQVLEIVEALTDNTDDGDDRSATTWRVRKELYLERLPTKSAATLRVAAADKLHNARAILADFEDIGDEVWARFNAPKDEQLWYYRELSAAFERAPHAPEGLVKHFRRTVEQIEARAAGTR